MNESGFSYLYHYMKGVLVEEGKRKSSVSFILTYMRWKDVMGNLTISSRMSLFLTISVGIFTFWPTQYNFTG